MKDTVTCPNCELENAYFDGVVYVCPDCGNEWPTNTSMSAKCKLPKNNLDSSGYERLIEIQKPFFKLKHGKFYDCQVEHKHGFENMSIIPLAFEMERNRQFIMIDARRLFKANESLVHEIIDMDFDCIMNDGISEFEYSSLTILCATEKDMKLVTYDESIFFDIKESNEL